MPRTEEQLLEVVYARSSEISRRRRVRLVGIAAASLAAAVIVAYAVVPDPRQSDAIVDPAKQPARPKATDKPAVVPGGRVERPTSQKSPVPIAPPNDPRSQVESKPVTSACQPLISDAIGDTKDRRMDIRSGSISYADGRVTFVYRMRDLTGVYSTGEAVSWDLMFSFGGKRYTVRAAHASEPMGQSQEFTIFRDTDTDIATLMGTIDDDADTISLYMDVADFNDGEAQASRNEGRRPTEMRSGSLLTDLEMRTDSQKLATDGTDLASSSCDYKLA